MLLKKLFFSLFLFVFISSYCQEQYINSSKKIYLNSSQRVYIIFSPNSTIEVIDISDSYVSNTPISDNTLWFMLTNPFVSNSINGMILTKDKNTGSKYYWPLEFFKGEDKLPVTTINMLPDSNIDNQVNNHATNLNTGKTPPNISNINNKPLKINKSKFDPHNKKLKLEKTCEKVLSLDIKTYNDGIYDKGLSNTIDLIAVDDSFAYLRNIFINSSNINYNVDFYGFLVKTTQRVKETAISDDYKEPIFYKNKFDVIICDGKPDTTILVYSLFTLKNNQKLYYFMKEKNGGRDLTFKISPKQLLKNSYNLNKNTNISDDGQW